MWCDLSRLSMTQLLEFRQHPTEDTCRHCKGKGHARKTLFGLPGLLICGSCFGSGRYLTYFHRQ